MGNRRNERVAETKFNAMRKIKKRRKGKRKEGKKMLNIYRILLILNTSARIVEKFAEVEKNR